MRFDWTQDGDRYRCTLEGGDVEVWKTERGWYVDVPWKPMEWPEIWNRRLRTWMSARSVVEATVRAHLRE